MWKFKEIAPFGGVPRILAVPNRFMTEVAHSILQERKGVGLGGGVYFRLLNVVLYPSYLSREHDVQRRPEPVPPPVKIMNVETVPSWVIL